MPCVGLEPSYLLWAFSPSQSLARMSPVPGSSPWIWGPQAVVTRRSSSSRRATAITGTYSGTLGDGTFEGSKSG
jgi:hypothetical protein